ASATVPTDLSPSPNAVDSVLRIRVSQAGMYELTYDDMASAGVEGPFAGQSTALFRLYLRNQEIPIDVKSANGTFSSSGALRFWARYTRDPAGEDDYNELVLSLTSLGNSSGAPLRAATLDGTPVGPTSSISDTYAERDAEQDVLPLLDLPFGTMLDRF